MTTLNVSLQFTFTTDGTLQGIVVLVPPSSASVDGAWTSPPSQWSGHDRVRVEVSTVSPPADLTYRLIVNDTRMDTSGEYVWFILGLLAEGTSFVVEARYGGNTHPVRMKFATAVDALTGATTPAIRKKVAIFVAPTTDPPPGTTNGLNIRDVIALLPELVDEIRDRFTSGGPGFDTGHVLRSAEAIVRKLNILGGPEPDRPRIEPRIPTRE